MITPLRELLFHMVGMCWNKVPEGVFRDDEATRIVNELEEWINQHYFPSPKLSQPYDAMGERAPHIPDPLPEFKPDYVKCSKCHSLNYVGTNLTKFTCHMCNKINGLPKMTRIK